MSAHSLTVDMLLVSFANNPSDISSGTSLCCTGVDRRHGRAGKAEWMGESSRGGLILHSGTYAVRCGQERRSTEAAASICAVMQVAGWFW